MRIVTRLTLAALLGIAVVAVNALILVATNRDVQRELAKNAASEEILNGITSIRYLTLEYASGEAQRPLRQWRLRHASLATLLESRSQFSGEDEEVLSRIRHRNTAIETLFSQLVANQPGSETDSRRRAVLEERERRLTGQIVVGLETMISNAFLLSERSRGGVLAAQWKASLAIVTVSGLIVMVIAATMLIALRSVSRPLADLRKGTAIVGAGDLDFRLDTTARDEIGDLARAFNGMTERLQRDRSERHRAQEALDRMQADLAHVSRVATLGAMTTTIAHEINQPLGAIVNNASAGLRWLAASNLPEARRSAELVIEDGHRASDIVARIRTMVRKTPPHRDLVDVNDVIRDTLRLAQSEAQKRCVRLRDRLGDDIPLVLADRVQLQQVALNLIINAVEAMGPAGDGPREVVVSSERVDDAQVMVAVSDSGPGLGPAEMHRLFDPFFTTKPEGLGMGLAISRSLIEAHQGQLWAVANAPTGATFHFTLPAAAAGPA